jgi:hypothetical protein
MVAGEKRRASTVAVQDKLFNLLLLNFGWGGVEYEDKVEEVLNREKVLLNYTQIST